MLARAVGLSVVRLPAEDDVKTDETCAYNDSMVAETTKMMRIVRRVRLGTQKVPRPIRPIVRAREGCMIWTVEPLSRGRVQEIGFLVSVPLGRTIVEKELALFP